MSKIKLAPSILNADFFCLKDVVKMLETAKVDLIHLDVMDGNFVPNITFGTKFIEAIKKITSLPLSVHLMVENPDVHINEFAKIIDKNDVLIVHVETCIHLDSTLQTIKKANIKAGIALNPATPLENVKYVLEYIDNLLIMSVNPGFGGQNFIPVMMSKIKEARIMIDNAKRGIDIQVDGGIKINNILDVIKAGATNIVVGSDIFMAEDPLAKIKKLKDLIQNY